MFVLRFAVLLLLAAAAGSNGANVELSLVPGSSGKPGQLTVRGAPPGSRLQFLDGVHALGAVVVDSSGVAPLNIGPLAPGPHTIRAVEWGTGRIAAAPLHITLETTPADSLAAGDTYATGIQSAVAAFGRLEGDGLPDLVLAGTGGVILLRNQGGVFAAPVKLATVPEPTAITLQDFNGDGRKDLAISLADGRVAILVNRGSGQFAPARYFIAGSRPSSMASADFNSDGIPDLAIANQDSNNVSILLGKGDGTFQPAIPIPAGYSPRALVAADFNGDGVADLAIANFGTNDVSILLGDGNGGFRRAGTYPAGNGPASLVVSDFDEDGSPDLAVLNQLDGSVSVLLNDGAGGLRPAASIPDVFGLTAGDMDGDGHIDLVVESGGVIRVLRGRGDGAFTEGYTALPQVGASVSRLLVALQNFEGDGRLDVAAIDSGGVLTMLLGRAEAPVTRPVEFSTTEFSTTQISSGEVSRVEFKAGKSRALTPVTPLANTPTSITLGSSANPATFGRPLTLTATVSPASGATGSVTFYDGTTILGIRSVSSGQATLTTSLLASGSRSLKAYYAGNATYTASISAPLSQTINSTPAIGFQTAVNYAGGSTTIFVAVGDFNGDGKADLAVANFNSNNVSVLLGNGDGTFQAASSYAAGSTPFSIAVGDFNGDGKTDLAVANRGAGSINGGVSILLGNGNGTFQPAVSYGAGILPSAVAVGDFNGDGKADLVVANNGSANVSVLLGNGDGTFQAAVNYPANTQPYSVTVSDLTGAGIADLVVSNNTGDGVSILMGNGDGTFQPAVGFGAGSSVGVSGGPMGVAMGDFSGDGISDLAAVFQGSNDVSVFLGNSGGTFQAPVNYPAGTQPSSIAAADFNGDGRIDLVVANQGGNNVSVLLAAASLPPTVGIDALPATIGGGTTISGWVFDNFLSGDAPIASVVVKVDGAIVGNAAIGGVRNDICLVYSYTTNCPILGYTYSLNTSGLATGTHTITVSASDANSVPGVGSASASVVTVASVPPTVVIDSPASGSALNGVVTISGWALDNTSYVGSAIGSVVVKVDGAVVGNASYGVSRPDVCAAYPGRANCPNVGYSYQLNTNGLATGSHTITVSATDTDTFPDTGSASVTVTTTNVPPLVAIDSPTAGSVLSGTVTISGWAIDNGVTVGTAIASVQVKVDGTVVGNANYGINRPDVCAAYPGRPGCPNVGYSYALNTSVLTAGSHVITVSATDSDGSLDIGSRSVTISVASAPPDVYIESPTAGSVVSGTVTVSGWAVDSAVSVGTPITSVVVKVDGTAVGNATYGISRPDICATYPARPGCPNVGFSYALDTTRLTPGAHMLSVVATDSDNSPESGSWTVAIQVILPPSVYIDSLAPGATLSGTVTVSGWAIDSTAAIGSVQIKVDGTVAGNATYGVPRADVCVVYPGRPGCPNVGFTYQLNTALLSAGTHTLTAVATDTEATPASASYSMTVTVTGPLPPSVYIDSLAPGATVSGTVTVGGWAIDSATAIGSVQIKVDGAVVGNATYGVPRADVCVVYPGRPGCPNVGFTYQLNTASMNAGTHTITAVATDTDANPQSSSYSMQVIR